MTSTYEFRGDAIQPLTVGLDSTRARPPPHTHRVPLIQRTCARRISTHHVLSRFLPSVAVIGPGYYREVGSVRQRH